MLSGRALSVLEDPAAPPCAAAAHGAGRVAWPLAG